MRIRNVKKTVKGHQTYDGAGVKLIRVIGPNEVKDVDPFLMLDAFDSKNPEDYIKGFPMHPHRGIETITYLIKGEMVHRDSLKNEGIIHTGESQWMTAGSGILHEEMPIESDHFFGLQIWLNLAQKDKMVNPAYFDIKHDMIKTINEKNATVRIISGSYNNAAGVTTNHLQVNLFDVTLKPNEDIQIDVPSDQNLFIYVIEGEGYFGEDGKDHVENRTAAIFDRGDTFYGKSSGEGIRFMLLSGEPLNEPIAWGGPIVMNDELELEEAFNELQNGTFIKENPE
ncbi:MAG: pirin family protein [Methanobrevibacter sp.]|jgi:redox-sensitive bicupin YhaK (pirin superfamily)|nr:pirin family protein [Candidatus Methanovirga aequatorialis]